MSATDTLISDLAAYALADLPLSDTSLDACKWALFDAVGCALSASHRGDANYLLGNWFKENPTIKSRVLGHRTIATPLKAAFDNTVLIRWEDYNDTWLSKEWGHPSDNLGGLLALYDAQDLETPMSALAQSLSKTYEIQGQLAEVVAFNQVGLDHVALVKIASTSVLSSILCKQTNQVESAISHALIDGHPLRTYRHYPNTTSRKSWAAGDAVERSLKLAYLAANGEPAIPSALTAKPWGLAAVTFEDQVMALTKPLGNEVLPNILYKVGFPAEFHGQTAVECALKHHEAHFAKGAPTPIPLDAIDAIELTTQQAGFDIINKPGIPNNPADRDHSLQYMVAAALIAGEVTSDTYQDSFAEKHAALIKVLIEKMTVTASETYTRDYFDPSVRAIPNQVSLTVGSEQYTEEVSFPLGHPSRRNEAYAVLKEKGMRAAHQVLSDGQCEKLERWLTSPDWEQPITEWLDLVTL